MKTVLIELLAFVLLCVFGAAAGGFFIMIYHSVASFVVGSQLNVFSIGHFLVGAVIFFPIFLLFVPMFLFLTLVRHPSYNKIAGAVTIAVLSLATWIFAAPFFYKASQEQGVLLLNSTPENLTSGYFRKINGKLNYFTLVSGNFVNGMRVNESYFSGNSQDRSIKILDNNYINFKRDELGFCDPLVGENLTPPPVLSNFLKGTSVIHQKAFESCMTGTIQWLLFSSIMAALVSIGAVISASEWKLADAFYITFDTFVILTLNYFCFTDRVEPLADALKSLGGIGAALSGQVQPLLNGAIIFLLALLGTVKALVHAAQKRRSAE